MEENILKCNNEDCGFEADERIWDDYAERGITLGSGSACPLCGDTLLAVCAFCRGEGVRDYDEDDGEGHTARGVGSGPCHCRAKH